MRRVSSTVTKWLKPLKIKEFEHMREKDIEAGLVREVRRLGGMCPKFVSPGLDGMPDRIVMMPEGKMAFCELKAPGKKMRPLQRKRKEQLEALGYRVYCIDAPERIGEVIDEILRA